MNKQTIRHSRLTNSAICRLLRQRTTRWTIPTIRCRKISLPLTPLVPPSFLYDTVDRTSGIITLFLLHLDQNYRYGYISGRGHGAVDLRSVHRREYRHNDGPQSDLLSNMHEGQQEFAQFYVLVPAQGADVVLR